MRLVPSRLHALTRAVPVVVWLIALAHGLVQPAPWRLGLLALTAWLVLPPILRPPRPFDCVVIDAPLILQWLPRGRVRFVHAHGARVRVVAGIEARIGRLRLLFGDAQVPRSLDLWADTCCNLDYRALRALQGADARRMAGATASGLSR